jgi:hypothetical protein
MNQQDWNDIALRCRLDMQKHDSLSLENRMINYTTNGLWEVVDPTWNRQNRPAPKPRYKLSPAQLRRMRII